MQALLKKREKTISAEKTVYMEMIGEKRICCRVTSGTADEKGDTYTVYGVELEMKIGPVRFREQIEDFSEDVEEAVEFAGRLIECGIKPSGIYNAALVYLGSKI
ncbi:MAG: hypothetical protein ACI4I9_04375 [Porcipelethomonas sp.]